MGPAVAYAACTDGNQDNNGPITCGEALNQKGANACYISVGKTVFVNDNRLKH